MRRTWLLCWLIVTVLPCWAVKRLSVAQLQHLLSADVAAHRRDPEIAKQIAGIALAERISPATFAALDAHFHASPLASQALRLLADQSQFLDLPADESVTETAPDSLAQARMIEAAREYTSQTLRRLPNFLATRTIILYNDTPQAIKQGDWPTRAGLHPVGKSSAEISVTREREDQPPAQGSAVWQAKAGLLSGGEFGTTLGMILTDAPESGISWSHWERESGGLIAVFRYSVPAPASHFEVISSFQREASLEGVVGPKDDRGVSGMSVKSNVNPNNVELVRTRPGYHGSIWVDPADGAIHRVTIEADVNKGLPFQRAAILVEYGAVEIAGSRFICPLRSLALSETLATAQSLSNNSATTWLNETLFTDYHRFASTSRIMEEAANPSAPNTGVPLASQRAAPDAIRSTEHPSDSVEPTQPSEILTSDANQANAVPPATPPAPPSTTANDLPGKVPGDESLPPSDSSPNVPARSISNSSNATQPLKVVPEEKDVRLSINVNSLLVPVVVLDKTGRSVAGLGAENFTVEDEGKHRKIVGFTAVGNAQQRKSETVDGRGSISGTGSAQNLAGTSNESTTARMRLSIVLFDDRHLTAAQLPLVQKAAVHLFENPLPKTDRAAVVSFMGVNSGLTHDGAVLQSTIMKLSVHQALQAGSEDCPDVDYYSADQIINRHNPMEFQVAVDKARQCSMNQAMVKPSSNIYEGLDNPTNVFQRAAIAAATHSLAIGEQDALASLLSLRSVVLATSKLPGERTLIFVSPGFLTLSPETMALKSEILNIAAASNVIVNTLDARGLYAGNVDASTGATRSTLGNASGQVVEDHLASMHASENVLSEIADGTGGRFFHNSNDLQGGMETLTAGPENLYLLEVSINEVKQNGAFHRLQVKIDQPGLAVVARKGYFAPKVKVAGK